MDTRYIQLRCLLGKLQPKVWQSIAFTYDGIDKRGTLHVDESFGYFDENSSPLKDIHET